MIARLTTLGLMAICACLLALLPLRALATGSKPSTPTPTGPQPFATAKASAQANGVASVSGVAGYGGVGSTGDFYVLPAPVTGSNLPAGMCQTSKYEHFSIGWNFYSQAKGDSATDRQCLADILTIQKMRIEASQAKPEPRLPDVPKECIHPAPKKQTAVQAVKRKRVCA